MFRSKIKGATALHYMIMCKKCSGWKTTTETHFNMGSGIIRNKILVKCDLVSQYFHAELPYK